MRLRQSYNLLPTQFCWPVFGHINKKITCIGEKNAPRPWCLPMNRNHLRRRQTWTVHVYLIYKITWNFSMTHLDNKLHHGHRSAVDDLLFSAWRRSSTGFKEFDRFTHRKRHEPRRTAAWATLPWRIQLESLQIVCYAKAWKSVGVIRACIAAAAPMLLASRLLPLPCSYACWWMFMRCCSSMGCECSLVYTSQLSTVWKQADTAHVLTTEMAHSRGKERMMAGIPSVFVSLADNFLVIDYLYVSNRYQTQ